MEEITFSYNWNNKLNCTAFATLRRHNPEKHKIGEKFLILGVGKHFTARIDAVSTVRFAAISETMAQLDTGYPLEEAREIMKKMYPDLKPETKFDFILLRRVPKDDQQTLNFGDGSR